MSIRLPLKVVLDRNNSVEVGSGPASVNGGIAYAFTLPQDTDGVVVKLAASVLGGGVSATLQTTDDGGTTWYDVARSSVVSNANAANAEWLAAPVFGFGTNSTPSIVATGSVLAGGFTIGNAAASTLGQKSLSGLPILGIQGRVFMRYGAAITSVISERITVLTGSQSATA